MGGFGRRRWRLGVLAPLDAVDDGGRLAPALLDRRVGNPPQGHPLRAGRPPGLNDIEFAPGGVDPYAEAGQVVVPEDRIPVVGLQPLRNPLGQSKRAALRHRLSPGINRPSNPSSNRMQAASTRGLFDRISGGDAGGR